MSSKRLITVRRATAADAEAIRALQDAALRIQAGADYEAGEIASFIRFAGTLDSAALAGGTYFVAVVEGEIVASGGWSTHSAAYNEFLRSGEAVPAGTPVIRGIYVDPVYAASGLAQRLLKAIENDITVLGHDDVVVATLYGAMPFYTAAGYRPANLLSLAFPDGHELHGVRMGKTLCLTLAVAA